jgi:hypothetical protein
VSQQAANTGVPDGDSRLSIIRNYKFINTLRPHTNGTLEMYVSVTPNGVIHQLTGAGLSTFKWVPAPTTESGISMTTVSTAGALVNNPLFGNTLDPGSFQNPPQWRLVNAVHRFEFTGSSLYNSGTVVVNPVNTTQGPITIATSSAARPTRPVSFFNPTPVPLNNANTYTGSARTSFGIVQLPRDTAYDDTEVACGTQVLGNRSPFLNATANDERVFNYPSHPSIRVYRVLYSGLNAEASITITSDVCIQYLVSPDSTEATLAKPSEMTDTSLLNNFLGSVGASPMVMSGVSVAKDVVKHVIRKKFPTLQGIMDAVDPM